MPSKTSPDSELLLLLHELQFQHRSLDQAIIELIEAPPADELLIRRLKKQKLLLKDKIRRLESLLIPDMPA